MWCYFTKKLKIIPVLSLLMFLAIHSSVFSQEPDSLKEGIAQYKEENYEEAVEILKKARQDTPYSSVAAFFLGMAYKQVMDYEKALVQFQDAVTLTPRIKEALVELIDVALQLEKKEIALKWIAVAERENIFPAKIAFLKGLVLAKEGKSKEAIEAFEKAKSLDPSVAQAADIQIAMSHLRNNELEKAGKRFKSAVLQDPQSDLAGFARQYQDMIEQKLWAERPFRFTLGVFGQYDTNVVLKPTDESLAAPDTEEESPLLSSSFRINYIPNLQGPYLFSAQYSIASGLHQKNSSTHDSLSNSISISPGYNFGHYALSLATTYTLIHVKSPSYKEYQSSFSTGPLLRWVRGNNNLFEIFLGYDWNEFKQPALTDDEDRDGNGPNAYFSWVWLFKENAFFNFRYQYNIQDTDGLHWDYKGNKFSLNLIYPLSDVVKFQASGQAYLQNYDNARSDIFLVPREDETYTLSVGLIWQFYKTANLIAQYTRIRGKSNIPIYDYEKDLYTLGCEYVF